MGLVSSGRVGRRRCSCTGVVRTTLSVGNEDAVDVGSQFFRGGASGFQRDSSFVGFDKVGQGGRIVLSVFLQKPGRRILE